MKTILITVAGGIVLSAFSVRAATVEIDPARSRIQVDAKATGHAFTGNLQKFTVKAEGDATTAKPTKLELSWDFNDLKTGDEKRDVEMIKWLGGGKPKGTFSFDKSWDEKSDGGSAQGSLTMNGASKTLGFHYTVKHEGGWVTIDGKAGMDYQNFKLPLIRSMAVMTVDPQLMVRFHLVGKVK
ncbi:MAG: YceI family protein [Luteolibacter sp.]|uniref:YceI family protein n=1 Tax=Luteolibacter sp. TaxID=1962973 RepID=UPI003266AAE8